MTSVEPTTNEWDPTAETYWRSLAEDGLAIAIVGGVVILLFAIFFLTRCVCCVCAEQADCCAKSRKDSTCFTLTFFRLLAAVLLLCAVGGGIILATAGPELGRSTHELVTTLVDQVSNITTTVDNTIAAIDEAVPDPARAQELGIDSEALSSSRADLQAAQQQVDQYEEDVRDVVDVVKILMVVVGVCAVVCGVSALLFILFPSAIFLVYIFFIVVLFVVAASFMIAITGTVVREAFADGCTMMDLHVEGVKNEWVLDNVQCAELQRINGGLDDVMKAANVKVDEANMQLQEANEAATAYAETFGQLEPEQQALLLGAGAPPAFTTIPLLCLPFSDASGQWQPREPLPSDTCVVIRTAEVQAAYEPLVCENFTAPLDADLTQDTEYQLECVLQDTPIPVNYYESALDATDTFDELNQALPTIRSIASCEFLDNAFAAMVDECEPVDNDLEMALAGALIAAGALSLSALVFCTCMQNIRKQDKQSEFLSREKDQGQ